MGGKKLRILHLEDDPNDRELVRATLEKDGLACEVEDVSTGPDFVAALDRGDMHIILSDFALPGFDGLSALRITREKSPGTPFIICSGTLGEEAAIESMRSGATDYVLKQRLSRLVPAVRRAIDEADERRRRRQVEEALQNERLFLRAMLESLEVGILACDSNGTLTLFNRATREIHGMPEEALSPEGWTDRYGLFHPDGKTPMDREETPLFRALQGERVRNAELVIQTREGVSRTVVVGGQPIQDPQGSKLGAVVAMHDITERKQLEAQLRQSQKMEAVGRLAGGIAHDFNNLLNVITGYGELLSERLTETDPMNSEVGQIKKAAPRAAALTRQLLAFSRKQVVEPKVLELNAVLVDMDKMLRRLIGEDVELVTLQGKDLGRVKADPGQIEQVLMNLVVNARDAMPQGGKLTLETANVDLDERYAKTNPGSRPGRYVMLSVTDTGMGMDPEIQSHIFEPFFTTKEAGKGTGLGLATVYGIVKQNNGYISVTSEPGRGAAFKIYIPRVEEVADAMRARETTAPPRGSETILVVEDEETVRHMVREVLLSFGYTVLHTGQASEAIRICETHEGPIHLLMTDVVMPRMNGRELSKRVKLLRPDVQVLFMSGYTDSAIVQHGVLEPGVSFLQKPFALTAVAHKVREVLDAARPAPARKPSRLAAK